MSGYPESELKARALREAAADIAKLESPDMAWADQDQYAEYLCQRADAIEQGNDPAIPPEPMEAGSRLRSREGEEFVRWFTGHSDTSGPWLEIGGPLSANWRFSDLDVVEVWPAEPLPESS